MEFNISVKGDKIKIEKPVKIAHTGNVNTYKCNFTFSDEWQGLTPFMVLFVGGMYFTTPIIDNSCMLPYEACIHSGYIALGVFGTNGSKDDLRRISTCLKQLYIEEGAYQNREVSPEIPKPDFWEVLINKNIPYIGDNGNWYIYDIEKKEFVDSYFSAKGETGYTPKKGTDYWTENDKAEMAEYALEKVDNRIGDLENALDEIIAIQETLIGGDMQ